MAENDGSMTGDADPGSSWSPPEPPVYAPPGPSVYGPTPGLPGAHAVPGAALGAVAAIVSGALVLIGSALPWVSTYGSASRLNEDWALAAAVVAGLLLLVGGVVGLQTSSGLALAAGAAITFLGMFAVQLRVMVDLVDAGGGDISPHLGFVAWCGAAVGALIALAFGLTAVRGAPGATWACAVAGGGIGLFWIGLLQTEPLAGDGAADVAVAALLAGLPVAAIVLLTARTGGAALLAVGACGSWVASWAVFAIEGSWGGLPVPFPDTPALAALAILAMTCIGGVWWGGASAFAAFGGAGASLGTAQVISIVICGATALVTAGGAVSASDSYGGSFATFTGGGDYAGEEYADDYAYEDDLTYEEDYGESSDPDAYDPQYEPTEPAYEEDYPEDEVDVTECVTSVCDLPADQEALVTDLIEDSGSEGIDFDGQWIAQMQANAVTAGEDQVRSTYEQLSAEIPDLRVVYSNDYASTLPGYVLFFNAGPFSSGEEALDYCAELNRYDSSLCFARYLSDDPADQGSELYPS